MNLSVFAGRVGHLAAQIDNAEINNARKDKLGAEIRKRQELFDKIERLRGAYEYGLKVIARISTNYRDGRKEALETNVENSLDLAFPGENFKIKIDYETRGKQEIASLSIGKTQADGTVKWGSPHCRSGDFAKQLISLSVVYEIAIMLGCDTVMADEPLSNGDKISLTEIHDFFQRLMEQGLQTLTIEHEEEMYTGLPRREIILEKDRDLGLVQVVKNRRERGSYETTDDPTEDSIDQGGVFSTYGREIME